MQLVCPIILRGWYAVDFLWGENMRSINSAVTIFLALLIPLAVAGQGKRWEAIPDSELSMRSPKVEANADAEVLFWEVRIVDDYNQRAGWKTVLNHHLRLKIFTERGREMNSKVDITYGNVSDVSERLDVKDIIARVVKPDGTAVELKNEDIFDREVVRGNGIKFKAKSFAVPSITVGSIIEYKWKEIRSGSYNYSRIELAREFPVQYVKYYIRPAMNVPIGIRLHSIKTDGQFREESPNVYSTTMTNVPSVKNEPNMPSEYRIKPWVLVYYDNDNANQSAEDYWKERGRDRYDKFKGKLKVNDEFKKAAVEAIGDAVAPEEKLRRIYDRCVRGFQNVFDDASGLTPDQLADFKPNGSLSEALKRGKGGWLDKQAVFATMAMAAGFDVRMVAASSKLEPTLDRNQANDYFIRYVMVAVKLGDDWRFFSPSSTYTPFGMIPDMVEGQFALILDGEPVWRQLPVAGPSDSVVKRTARLNLTADGGLEGDLEIAFSGHAAAAQREFLDDDADTEREEYIRDWIKGRIGDQTEVTSIEIVNLLEHQTNLIWRCKIRNPAYAEKTGKRSFVRTNIFTKVAGPKFVSAYRAYDIQFPYAWSEIDDISIVLPDGSAVESVESPEPINDKTFGTRYSAEIKLSENRREIIYKRAVSIGNDGLLSFSRDNYVSIKELFDLMHLADSRSVVLKNE